MGNPASTHTMQFFSQMFSWGSETLQMTCEGFWEMFEGDLADMCIENSQWYLWEEGGDQSVACVHTLER